MKKTIAFVLARPTLASLLGEEAGSFSHFVVRGAEAADIKRLAEREAEVEATPWGEAAFADALRVGRPVLVLENPSDPEGFAAWAAYMPVLDEAELLIFGVRRDMQRRGLERAVATGNAHFDYVFRSAPLSRCEAMGDKPGFLRAADGLIAHYQAQADDSLLYSTWARRADRLLMWGDYVDAVLSLRGMADYARHHHHPFGQINADFYFGQCYLSNGQDSVAARHYRQAMAGAIRYGSPGLVARSGFNLVNILQGWRRYDEALALSDSLPAYIRQWEVMKGIAVNPVLRVQNAMYRLKVLISRADLPAATAWRDTMLLYNKMYADPSQQEELQYTLARYERLAGNNAEAGRILRLLADYSRSRGNQARMARYYRSLADVLHAERRYAEAADCYRLYAEAADSAQVATSNAQLNRLSRLYRLDELEQEKRDGKIAMEALSRSRDAKASLEKEVNELKEANAKLKSELEESRKQAPERKEHVDQNGVNVDELVAKNEDLEKSRAQLQAEVQQMKSEDAKIRESLEQLRTEAEQAQKREDECRKENESLHSLVSDLMEKSEEQEQKEDELMKQLDSIMGSIHASLEERKNRSQELKSRFGKRD